MQQPEDSQKELDTYGGGQTVLYLWDNGTKLKWTKHV